MKKLIVPLMILASLVLCRDVSAYVCKGPMGLCTIEELCKYFFLCGEPIYGEPVLTQWTFGGDSDKAGTEYIKSTLYKFESQAPIPLPNTGLMWAKVSDWITVGGQPLRHTYACIQDDTEDIDRLVGNFGIKLSQRWLCEGNIGSSDKGTRYGIKSHGNARKFFCATGKPKIYQHVGKPYELGELPCDPMWGYKCPADCPYNYCVIPGYSRWEGILKNYTGKKACRIIEFVTGDCQNGTLRMLYSAKPGISLNGVGGWTYTDGYFGKLGFLFGKCKLACNL